jgi:ATP-dependent RNA helicase RhlE
MSFVSFNLHPQLAAGIKALGYCTPTPIQRQSIPPVLSGRDVMGCAQTGTGKTAAFALPILERLIKGPRGHIRALVIAPTRELAEQINTVFADLGRQTRLRSITIYGGVALQPQIQRLRAGVEIAVACPGRLLDHIRHGTIKLSSLEVLVLDEADRMFDMGFLPDIREIITHLPPHRQTLLFAATMPDDIRRLANEILRTPVTVQVNAGVPACTVTHALYPVDHHLKSKLLLRVLRDTDTRSVLIFARTKLRAKRLGEQLGKAGYRAASLQGNLSQNRRREALEGFRDGSYQVLVATDIAARGIDVSRISHVINYDMPDTPDAYTHRIGRTGRAERTGDAFTFMTGEDRAMVRDIERVMGEKLECRRLKDFDYNEPVPVRGADPGQTRHAVQARPQLSTRSKPAERPIDRVKRTQTSHRAKWPLRSGEKTIADRQLQFDSRYDRITNGTRRPSKPFSGLGPGRAQDRTGQWRHNDHGRG